MVFRVLGFGGFIIANTIPAWTFIVRFYGFCIGNIQCSWLLSAVYRDDYHYYSSGFL